MKNCLMNNKIYSSEALQEFILSLETQYNIENAQEKYHNLVNFSANAAVPFHQWFIYREGFAGELIASLIAMSGVQKEEVVIDPFCGSGTTNVVASMNGYKTLGLDVNPMSAFISNAKIKYYEKRIIDQVRFHVSFLRSHKTVSKKPYYSDVERYFSAANYHDLLVIKSYIDSLPNSKARDLMFVAYLSIIIDCSDRKRDGNGLKVRPSKVTDVYDCYEKKIGTILNDITVIKPCSAGKSTCVYESANNLCTVFQSIFKGFQAGAIIFSPPYPNSFDYFESYKLELVMGDFAKGLKGLNEFRQKAVRSFVGAESQSECDDYVDLIAKEIESAIPVKEQRTGKKDARTRKVPNMIRGYFSDMHETIRQCSGCLSAGKKVFIVVDQSAYVGKIVPTDLLLAYYGEQEGFTVGRIIKCRNARTSTQQLNEFPFLKASLRESIVELIKQ